MPGRRPRITLVDEIPPKNAQPRRQPSGADALAAEIRAQLEAAQNGQAVRVANQPYNWVTGIKRHLGAGYHVTTRNLRPCNSDGQILRPAPRGHRGPYVADVYVIRKPEAD
jgi:hypothetical protein